MIIFDIAGNIWFKLKDLLKILGYKSISHALQHSKISKNNKQIFENLKVVQTNTLPLNFQKSTIFIIESGLYEILAQTTKPLAKLFMDKYYKDIMPSIRKMVYIL